MSYINKILQQGEMVGGWGRGRKEKRETGLVNSLSHTTAPLTLSLGISNLEHWALTPTLKKIKTFFKYSICLREPSRISLLVMKKISLDSNQNHCLDDSYQLQLSHCNLGCT